MKLIPFGLLKLITFIIMVNSRVLSAEITLNTDATNEQYLIFGTIQTTQRITGLCPPSEIISSNQYGGKIRVYLPQTFERILITDYKIYRIEHRLTGNSFFATNVSTTNIVLIVKGMNDVRSGYNRRMIFAEPCFLPEDIVQKYNFQGALVLQTQSITHEGSTVYDSMIKEYDIKLPVEFEKLNTTNIPGLTPWSIEK